jgi:DNA-binding transcriptional LysR family regulator
VPFVLFGAKAKRQAIVRRFIEQIIRDNRRLTAMPKRRPLRRRRPGGRILAMAASSYAIRNAPLHHAGWALLPEWLVQHDVKRGRLRIHPSALDFERTLVNALHRVELRGTSRVRLLVNHLRKEWARVHP